MCSQDEERALVFKPLEADPTATGPGKLAGELGTIRLEVTFGELSKSVTAKPKAFNRDFFSATVGEDQVKPGVTERAA